MSFELINTSAEKGLKPGSRGFCTVAMTNGMPAHCVQLCEAFSNYTHVYDLNSGNYEQNPVAWSHYRLKAGGKFFSMVSRVSAHPRDYTGRTNKIAHHLLLENPVETERFAGGPEGLLHNPFFQPLWEGSPTYLPEKPPPREELPAEPFKAVNWLQMGLPAELAAKMANMWGQGNSPTFVLIYDHETDSTPAGIIQDLLKLLPPARRWEIGFSTYYTSHPLAAENHIRACFAGTEAAQRASRIPGAVILNLAKGELKGGEGLPSPPADLLSAAQNGTPPKWAQKTEPISEGQPRPKPAAKLRPGAMPPLPPKSPAPSGRKIVKFVPGKRRTVQPGLTPPKRQQNQIPWIILGSAVVLVLLISVVVLPRKMIKTDSEPKATQGQEPTFANEVERTSQPNSKDGKSTNEGESDQRAAEAEITNDQVAGNSAASGSNESSEENVKQTNASESAEYDGCDSSAEDKGNGKMGQPESQDGLDSNPVLEFKIVNFDYSEDLSFPISNIKNIYAVDQLGGIEELEILSTIVKFNEENIARVSGNSIKEFAENSQIRHLVSVQKDSKEYYPNFKTLKGPITLKWRNEKIYHEPIINPEFANLINHIHHDNDTSLVLVCNQERLDNINLTIHEGQLVFTGLIEAMNGIRLSDQQLKIRPLTESKKKIDNLLSDIEKQIKSSPPEKNKKEEDDEYKKRLDMFNEKRNQIVAEKLIELFDSPPFSEIFNNLANRDGQSSVKFFMDAAGSLYGKGENAIRQLISGNKVNNKDLTISELKLLAEKLYDEQSNKHRTTGSTYLKIFLDMVDELDKEYEKLIDEEIKKIKSSIAHIIPVDVKFLHTESESPILHLRITE